LNQTDFKNILQTPYLAVNAIFSIIIILVIAYSAYFPATSNDYFISSNCLDIPEFPCLSRGLSRSFSEIVRLNFANANAYNPLGIKLFVLILTQFIFRIMFSFIYLKTNSKKTITLDLLLSIPFFIFSMFDFILNYVHFVYKML